MSNIIIGGGISGIAAALEFESKGVPYILLEKNNYLGGHCSSYIFESCIFDEGPHISFTKNEILQNSLWRKGDNFITKPEIQNYWKGKWIPQPVITHLAFLPFFTKMNVILSFLLRPRFGVIDTYQEWNHRKFGRYYSANFVASYTRKYWTLEPRDMSIDWVEKRIYSPNLREVLYGAFTKSKKKRRNKQHYVQKFVYPNKNGFQEFVNRLVEQIKNKESLHLNTQVRSIDYLSKQIHLDNGKYLSYTNLISTIPLPNLVRALNLEPSDSLLNACQYLRATTLTLVDLIYDVKPIIAPHWCYIYDEQFLSTRVHFPFMLNSANCPPGLYNLQIEIYTQTVDISDAELIARVVSEMQTLGICADRATKSQVKRIEYANVIFDHQHKVASAEILPFLRNAGINTAGRFGNWDYSWSDDAYSSGANAANDILLKEGLK